MPKPLAPARERVYQYERNRRVSAQGSTEATVKAVYLEWKSIMTGFSRFPWEHEGSSDATTAALDGIDRVTDASKITFASSGAHSWNVISQPQTGMHVCFDWNTNNSYQASVIASLTGFTGGSISARPTAIDEQILISADNWAATGNTPQVLHAIHSTDGTQTMFLACQGGDAKTWFVFGTALQTVPGWTTPYFAFVAAQTSTGAGFHATEHPRIYSALPPIIKSWGPGGRMDMFVSTLATYWEVCTGIEPSTGKPRTLPLALVSLTPGMQGRHGRLGDLWIVGLVGRYVVGNGYFPGTTQFAVFGDFMIPWGGGPPPEYA